MPLTISSTIEPPVLVPPAPRPTQRSIQEITFGFFKERTKEIVKMVGYAAGWATQLRPDFPSSVRDLGGLMTDFKNFICITEIPEKTDKVSKAFKQFFHNPSIETARGVLKEVSHWTNSAVDGIGLSSKFVHIQHEALRIIKGFGFTATIAGSLNGVVQEGQEIAKIEEPNEKKTLLHLFNMARDVSYLALGIIGLSFVVSGTPFVAAMMLTPLTFALAFTVGGYFYERTVDPYQKHENPTATIANLRDQNQYLTQRMEAAGLVV